FALYSQVYDASSLMKGHLVFASRRLAGYSAWWVLALLGMGGVGAHAEEVGVAVATNFLLPMRSVALDFTAATGHKAVVSGGSTGKLYSQIVAGAPFDVLLAADAKTPQRLVDEGHGVAGSNFTYAIGQLVLWSADADRVDTDG